MLIFIKIMGVTAISAAGVIWWWMVAGILEGKIEATTKGNGEVWFNRLDSPTAFWVVLAVHFCAVFFFLWLGYSILRKDDHPTHPDQF